MSYPTLVKSCLSQNERPLLLEPRLRERDGPVQVQPVQGRLVLQPRLPTGALETQSGRTQERVQTIKKRDVETKT